MTVNALSDNDDYMEYSPDEYSHVSRLWSETRIVFISTSTQNRLKSPIRKLSKTLAHLEKYIFQSTVNKILIHTKSSVIHLARGRQCSILLNRKGAGTQKKIEGKLRDRELRVP